MKRQIKETMSDVPADKWEQIFGKKKYKICHDCEKIINEPDKNAYIYYQGRAGRTRTAIVLCKKHYDERKAKDNKEWK